MIKKIIHFNTDTIHYEIFKSMSMISVLFMTVLFLGISGVFLYNSFTLRSEDSIHQLDYISRQFQYYLTSADNYSRTILSDARVQEYMTDYVSSPDSPPDTSKIKEQICQIIQSTSFIHSVCLFAVDGTFLLATESFTEPEDMASLVRSPVWSTGVKTKVGSRNEQIKVLSYTRPFYEISSGDIIGYIEIAIPESGISQIYTEQSGEQSMFMTDSKGVVQSTSGTPELNSMFEDIDRILEDHSGTGYFFTGWDLIFYTYFPTLDWYIVSRIPIIMFLHSMLFLFGISLLIAALVMGTCVYVSQRTAHRVSYPLSFLVGHIQKVKNGQWEPVKEIRCNEESASLFHAFNSMIARQTRLRDDLVQAEKMKRQLSLSLLHEQIKPHFLYNTLDNICSLAELDEKDTLIRLTMSLSSFYRSCLSNGKTRVTVEEELNISQYYLEIMGIRYYNKFDYTISCSDSLRHCECIKLLLQPIIENSIYHGIKELSRFGHIRISAEETGDTVVFTVEDNGKGISADDLEKVWTGSSGHFGIKNIHQRIQFYYGEQYGLTITGMEGSGCVTKIIIPRQEVS